MMINTLMPRQNGRHFADDIFKCIFLIENIWNSINISLRFVRKGRINNISALVQIMAWRLPGGKPLSEPMMVYRRIYASLVLNELRAAKASWRCIKKEVLFTAKGSIWKNPHISCPFVWANIWTEWIYFNLSMDTEPDSLYPVKCEVKLLHSYSSTVKGEITYPFSNFTVEV